MEILILKGFNFHKVETYHQFNSCDSKTQFNCQKCIYQSKASNLCWKLEEFKDFIKDRVLSCE